LFAVEPGALSAFPAAPLLGQILERRYALARFLGGNMGAVYEGVDLRLGRRIAVKVDRRAGMAGVPDRFTAEARAIAALTSHHAVTIFDSGLAVTPFGPAPFLVMELVDGESLAARIERGPLPLAEVAGLLDQVCEALAEAHAHGIVHRDVKPANILLTRDTGGRTVAKLIDFGIARVGSGTGTQWGMLLGTPNYMAPEQRRIYDPVPVDGRADIYALGVVLCEMLTGEMPFHRIESLQEGPWAHGTAREPIPAAPPPIARVLRQALAHEPEKRFPTAPALAAAFRAAVAAATPAPEVATPAAPERRLRRGAIRVIAVAASALAAALAATAGIRTPAGEFAPATAAPVRVLESRAVPEPASTAQPAADVSISSPATRG
jgi:serine/threonine-protein kinase